MVIAGSGFFNVASATINPIGAPSPLSSPVKGEEIGEEAGLFRHINDQTSFPKTATAQHPRFLP